MKLAAALVVVSAGAAAVLSKQGPPVAHTGGFGEPSCAACHLGEELNAPGGVLQLQGLPAAYEPGRAYTLTVVLQRAQLAIGGFELAARFEDGRQAGRFRPRDLRVFVADSAGIQYVHHTLQGVSAAAGRLTWQVRWQAPLSGGAVLFHLAGNASNDDASNLGDFIYTATARTIARLQK